GLDLLPADFSYRHMDIVLDQAKKPSRRLAKLLAPLASEYDYAFLDCPPSISLTSEAVFGASDALLVPIIPTTLSLRTLEQILAFREREGLGKVAVLPFFSLVDRRKRLHRDILEALAAERPELLRAQVPYASAVERMGTRREPLAEYAPRSAPVRAFAALWQEIVEHLEP
ncbi:MAG: ParA family protein, partial [Proteobacteria bacterium]|nr:ParA family protein [Pseudomonadota bacterium]